MEANHPQSLSGSDGFRFMEQTKDILSLEIKKLDNVISELKLEKQVRYVLKTEGKLLRPTMLLLSGNSVGGDTDDLGKLALSIELLHLATLVHDDILDQDLFRRNMLAVHAKWSIKEAILVGDALASLAISLCTSYGKEIVDAFTNTCLNLSDGEYMDVEITPVVASEDEYFEKIRKKSASLFKAAAKCGAIAGGGSNSEIGALESFGENYGTAFQIEDDIVDVTSIELRSSFDSNEISATLPMIRLLKKSPKAILDLPNRINASKIAGRSDCGQLTKRLIFELQKSGSLNYCLDKIDRHVKTAVEALGSLKETVFKKQLINMAESLRMDSYTILSKKTKAAIISSEKIASRNGRKYFLRSNSTQKFE